MYEYCWLATVEITYQHFNFIDPTSIPMLSIIVNNIESVNIIVTPPSVSPVCVLQYYISYSSSCYHRVTNITVNPNTDPTQPVQVAIRGLDLCYCSYTYTVAAYTSNGTGERGDPMSTGTLCKTIVVLLFIRKVTITLGSYIVTCCSVHIDRKKMSSNRRLHYFW